MKITTHNTIGIGGNCIEISTNQSRIILDIGLPLSQMNDLEPSLPIVDGLFQNKTDRTDIDAIFITHPHKDHYGLLNYSTTKAPCYMGKMARKLMELSNKYGKKEVSSHTFYELINQQKIIIKDICVTPFIVDHSAYDSYALLIESEGKTVLYTGDFRDHGRKEWALKKLMECCPRKIDVLITEGTIVNGSKRKIKTENELQLDIENKIQKTNGIVLAWFSPQNIDRLITIYKAAKKCGRTFVVDPYTALVLKLVNTDNKRIPLPNKQSKIAVFFELKTSKAMKKAGLFNEVMQFNTEKISKENLVAKASSIVMVVRPSMQSHLEKIGLPMGGAHIYSMWSGYLKQENSLLFQNYLSNNEYEMFKMNTSGHASENAVISLIDYINPTTIIPIHTEQPEYFTTLFDKRVCILKVNESFSF